MATGSLSIIFPAYKDYLSDVRKGEVFLSSIARPPPTHPFPPTTLPTCSCRQKQHIYFDAKTTQIHSSQKEQIREKTRPVSGFGSIRAAFRRSNVKHCNQKRHVPEHLLPKCQIFLFVYLATPVPFLRDSKCGDPRFSAFSLVPSVQSTEICTTFGSFYTASP